MTTHQPDSDVYRETCKVFTRERRGTFFKNGKRCSEDTEDENLPRSCQKQPRRTESFDTVEALSVRMKDLKVEVVRRLRSSNNTVVPTAKPISDPLKVRIRSRDDDNKFLTVDRSRQRPEMNYVGEDPRQAIFILEMYYSDEEEGKYCTLLHKASGRYLAVDEKTEEPVVRCLIHTPACTFPDTDISVRRRPGPQPLAPDEPDTAAVACSAGNPDRCCFFAVPYFEQPTYLKPKVCRHKCLSYDHTGAIKLVTMPRGQDFVVNDGESDDSA